MEHTTTISIKYEENCDYGESIAEKEIFTPLQDTEGIVKLKNTITREEIVNGESKTYYYYYTDTIEITSIFYKKDTNTIIKYGEVNFYYINKNDVQKTKQLINQSPISIDENGNAKVLFIPPEEGQIEATYISNDYFNGSTAFDTFELRPMPTKIKFQDPPAYLTKKENTIDLSVEVKDLNNNPIDYGIVTFLNYSKHDINNADDAYEKVIGNPIYVENGVATIKYSPIQNETDNDLYGSLELIKAVYNYDNDLYGIKWKYYDMSKNYTSVGLYRDNEINLLPPLQANVELSQGIGGMFVIERGQTLQLQCKILYNNQILENGKVSFYLSNIDKDAPLYMKSGNDVTYIQEKEVYEASFDGIPAGLYQVYAYVDEFEEDTSIQIAGTIPYSLVTNEPITDKKYVTGAYSNTYCLEITEKEYNYSIELLHPTDVIAPNQTYNPYCKIITDTPTLFENQECYFYITKTKQKIKGTIRKSNNELIGTPDSAIKFPNIGDYSLYVYVPPVNGKYEEAYSEGYLNIKVRNTIGLTISSTKDSISYPNKGSCTVSMTNLYDESLNVIIEIISENNQVVHSYAFENSFTRINHTQQYILPLLDVGTYTLKAYVSDNMNIMSTKTITINKGTLVMSINGTSTNVNTGKYSDIILGIEEIDGKDIITTKEDIQNNLIAALQHNNLNNIPILNLEVNDIIESYYTVTVTGTIYDKGIWGIKLDYINSNSNYNITDNEFLKFEAHNQNCYIQIVGDTTTTRQGRIGYEVIGQYDVIVNNKDYTYTIPQYIPIITTFKNDNNNTVSFMHITNDQGEFTITKPNNITDIAWSNYNIIEYTIDPQLVINETSIIDIIQELTYNEFVELFEQYNIQFTETQYNLLKQQCNEFNNVNLFLGYDRENNETELIYI